MIYWTRRLKCEVFVSTRVDLHYADAGTKRASIPSHFPNNAGAGRGGRQRGPGLLAALLINTVISGNGKVLLF